MAKLKVEWLNEARLDLKDILDYYIERNGSKKYSLKLNRSIKNSVELISANPLMGKSTQIPFIRVAVEKDYLIIYQLSESVLIMMIRDSRRDKFEQEFQKRRH